ncbi:MAG: hypothetical protein RLZZ455_757 [Candidatus Parcubacteria bacterium]|jgi:hypothetical protein
MPERTLSRPYISFETVFTENPVQSGFDLKPTIAWTGANKEILKKKMESRLAINSAPSPHPETITPAENTDLDPALVRPLIGLIPEGFRQLSACDQILGMDTLWFKNVAPGMPIEPTNTVSDAISPTALATGATTDEVNPPHLSVLLCKLPQDIIPDQEVRKLILGTTVVHEYFHTITWGLLNDPEKKIQLPDGSVVNGAEFIKSTFGKAAEAHSPVSHYSSGYRNTDNSFQEREGSTDLAIEEELVETLTTLTLGFASGNLRDVTRDPLDDREDLKKICQDFLNATPVATESNKEIAA